MISGPRSIYINWASYDELSDNVELTEVLALRQLSELLRLRAQGVRFDYYLMDAFWYAPDGGYRQWRQPHWPQGPDRWLAECLAHDVKPGLWLSGNTLCKLQVAPEWRDSLDVGGGSMSLFHGGFWPHLLETMRFWYARGVRMFKLDFMWLQAAPAAVRRGLLPSEIYTRNCAALRDGLNAVREACPEIGFIGYNGFEEADTQSATDLPLRKTVDPRWLDALDTLYCGDPRAADVPAMNFWRAKDIYSDHMVRVYEQNGLPLARIDNSGFMIGKTGTCYRRGAAAWKGMLLLSLARGGWANTYYGNLELINEADARWFARAQTLFYALQAHGRISTFGPMPGTGEPYGFIARDTHGTLYTVVNPAQGERTLALPDAPQGRILFSDAGFTPVLASGSITLGSEQMAVVGTGAFDAASFELGRQDDVRIPRALTLAPWAFVRTNNRELSATVPAPVNHDLRVVVRQQDKDGKAKRTSGGAPPNGKTMGNILRITAEQQGHPVAVVLPYDKAIWSGLSWAVGEIRASALLPNAPVTIHCTTTETADVTLNGALYEAIYEDVT